MSLSGFTGSFAKGAQKAEVSLSVVEFEQDGVTIIFAPAVQVYGYGNSTDEAKDSFINNLEEFLSYTINKNTLKSVLEKLGWKVKGRVKNRQYKMPQFTDLMKKNPELNDLINSGINYSHYQTQMALPA